MRSVIVIYTAPLTMHFHKSAETHQQQVKTLRGGTNMVMLKCSDLSQDMQLSPVSCHIQHM